MNCRVLTAGMSWVLDAQRGVDWPVELQIVVFGDVGRPSAVGKTVRTSAISVAGVQGATPA